MAIGLEDGSASRNATLGTAGAIWPLPVVMRPEAESAFARAHELEADVPMPFEHALVSLDDGRRLSAAENPPLHNSREPIGSSPNWGQTRSCRTCSSELVALRVTAVAESPAKLLGTGRGHLAGQSCRAQHHQGAAACDVVADPPLRAAEIAGFLDRRHRAGITGARRMVAAVLMGSSPSVTARASVPGGRVQPRKRTQPH
jgi:hypothetical protein